MFVQWTQFIFCLVILFHPFFMIRLLWFGVLLSTKMSQAKSNKNQKDKKKQRDILNSTTSFSCYYRIRLLLFFYFTLFYFFVFEMKAWNVNWKKKNNLNSIINFCLLMRIFILRRNCSGKKNYLKLKLKTIGLKALDKEWKRQFT